MIEKWDAFPFTLSQDVLILLRQFHIVIVYAPRSSGIEHRPPEAGAAVRIRPGVYFFTIFDGNLWNYRKYRRYEVKKIVIILQKELSKHSKRQVMTERMENAVKPSGSLRIPV